MQNCVGEVLLLGIFAVTAYRDWKEQMICVYVPLAAGIAGLVLHLMLPTQKLTDLLLGAGIGAVLLLAAWVSREEIGYGDGAMLMASGIFLGFWRNVELFLTALMLIVPAALFGLIVKHRRKDYRMPVSSIPFCGVCISAGMAVENGTKWRIYERMERKSDHRGGACGAARAGVVCIRHEERYSDVYRVQGHRAGDRAGAGNRGGKDVLPLAGSGGIISK